jgi:hypothetical protein
MAADGFDLFDRRSDHFNRHWSTPRRRRGDYVVSHIVRCESTFLRRCVLAALFNQINVTVCHRPKLLQNGVNLCHTAPILRQKQKLGSAHSGDDFLEGLYQRIVLHGHDDQLEGFR